MIEGQAAGSPAGPGREENLFISASDDAGEENLKYTWAKASGPGTITFTPSGSNTTHAASRITAIASTAGTYTFTVTVSDSGGLTVTSTTASLDIASPTATPLFTRTAITPPAGSVKSGAWRISLLASAEDQFGDPYSPTGTVTYPWSYRLAGTATDTTISGAAAARWTSRRHPWAITLLRIPSPPRDIPTPPPHQSIRSLQLSGGVVYLPGNGQQLGHRA